VSTARTFATVSERDVFALELGGGVTELRNLNEGRVRAIVAKHGGLSVGASGLDRTADLYASGMSSRASVSVMLALEADFDIEFPDAMLRREVFASIASITSAIEQIRAGVS